MNKYNSQQEAALRSQATSRFVYIQTICFAQNGISSSLKQLHIGSNTGCNNIERFMKRVQESFI